MRFIEPSMTQLLDINGKDETEFKLGICQCCGFPYAISVNPIRKIQKKRWFSQLVNELQWGDVMIKFYCCLNHRMVQIPCKYERCIQCPDTCNLHTQWDTTVNEDIDFIVELVLHLFNVCHYQWIVLNGTYFTKSGILFTKLSQNHINQLYIGKRKKRWKILGRRASAYVPYFLLMKSEVCKTIVYPRIIHSKKLCRMVDYSLKDLDKYFDMVMVKVNN